MARDGHVELEELAPLDPYASAAEHWTSSQYVMSAKKYIFESLNLH
jgi:hypothetical protein